MTSEIQKLIDEGTGKYKNLLIFKGIADGKLYPRYVKEEENLKKLRKLLNEKKVVNPIFMKGDFHPKRFLAMTKNYLSHFLKFKKYYS